MRVSVESGNQHETVLRLSNKEPHTVRLKLANLAISLTIRPDTAVVTILNGLGGSLSQVYSLTDETNIHEELRQHVRRRKLQTA